MTQLLFPDSTGNLARFSRKILSVGVISASFAAILTGCSKIQASSAAPSQMAVPVTVINVRQADVPLNGEWVGTLDGYVNAQIQPQVSGYMIRQNYREGSVVSKNEVLFEIDPRPFQAAEDQAGAQVEQAKGQLAQAQAQRELAQINLRRDTPLAEARAIAQSQLDNEKQQAAQADASVAATQAAVSAAQAALTTADLNLGFTKVRSLISGVAGQATTQVGNLVSPQSLLTSVSQLDPIKVYFSISDSEYLALVSRARKHGGDLLSGNSDLSLALTLADGTLYPHKGRIAFVDRQMNQQTGAIRIAASFPNPGNVLRPGQFGRVGAATELRRSALLVPQAAVQELQGIEQIYTAGPDNRVHVVNVTLGPQYGTEWIIDKGLKPDDRVITDNLQKLKDGAPINPHESSAQGSRATPALTGGR
jgi:membrane fusion protein (multidrug efflux system)